MIYDGDTAARKAEQFYAGLNSIGIIPHASAQPTVKLSTMDKTFDLAIRNLITKLNYVRRFCNANKKLDNAIYIRNCWILVTKLWTSGQEEKVEPYTTILYHLFGSRLYNEILKIFQIDLNRSSKDLPRGFTCVCSTRGPLIETSRRRSNRRIDNTPSLNCHRISRCFDFFPEVMWKHARTYYMAAISSLRGFRIALAEKQLFIKHVEEFCASSFGNAISKSLCLLQDLWV
ncbi:hypothetical protein CEXT_581821 [Caerostris extrusa]|uniref:Uncharacterized protein n=1 Tax=Caerostris extrusa TaxID=172846 RepID=A0AAV4R327_CAEEX|nr:hypothetical protein CEXT_581821 [Caerostris extrusa]